MRHLNVDNIDACLPQTQCTRCSYPCCREYAIAISQNEAKINQCPPGGETTIGKLATLTGRAPLSLDSDFGEYQPKTLAYIVEEKCIGCVLCIKACPVDAIVGANKLMHTVIQTHCTGCELCLPVCPTDCIEMRPLTENISPASDWPGYTPDDIKLGKFRFEKRLTRLARQVKEKLKTAPLDKISRQQAILEAVKRKQQAKKT